MAIESLSLTNWQCHDERTIEFDQITTLVGANDAGKSSVLRALLFAMLNRWEGAANTHVTFGQESSSIRLSIAGQQITREKGEGTNSYSLDGEPFAAFRYDVPPDIANLLNVSIDNFQQQGDPAFWLNLTSGQAASALNDIFCLSSIDDALSNIASQLRQVKTEKKVAEERLETARANSKTLYWTKEASADLKELEELHARIAEIEEEMLLRKNTMRSIQSLELQFQGEQERVVVVEKRAKIGNRLIEIQGEIDCIKSVIYLEEKIEAWSKTLYQKQQKLSEIMAGKCPLCKRG